MGKGNNAGNHRFLLFAQCFLPILKGISVFQPFPKQQILDSSKLKEFADDNFRFDGIGTKFFNRVENNVGKGEIARYKRFLRFPQCFQKSCNADT